MVSVGHQIKYAIYLLELKIEYRMVMQYKMKE
jgi:hypothetical protein